MNKLLSKFWFLITLVIVLILSLIWIFQIVFLEDFYIMDRTKIMEIEALHISQIIKKTEPSIISEELIHEVESFISSYNSGVILINESASIIPLATTDNNFKRRFKPENIPYEIMKNVIEKKSFKTIDKQRALPFKFPSITIGKPIELKDKTLYLIISSPLSGITATTETLKRQLTIIGIISLLIGSILAFVLSRVFSKPIIEINEASKKISEGKFDTQVQIQSNDEISMLANTINNMAVQLGQIEQLRKDFIANITHELKTPISSISAYAELISVLEDSSKEERMEYTDIIISEAHRLNKIVEEILQLSEIESGFYKPKFQQFHLFDLIDEVIQKLKIKADQKNITIKNEVDKFIDITADRVKMFQVFYNLIINSIKFSFDSNEVIVSANLDSKGILIKITDYGQGIPAKDLPHIWERFYKRDKARTRDENNNTGLGLSIVKTILELHNFSYGIDSTVNCGTTIWIRI